MRTGRAFAFARAMIPQSCVQELLSRVDIVDVIERYVPLKKSGANYFACCPFHGEKSPSFHCEDQKGRYHCFGCGVSGDHFKFLTELDGMAFPEAVERVAEMAGVPMPARDAEAEQRDQQRATLQDVMELATKFFQDQLQTGGGAKARAFWPLLQSAPAPDAYPLLSGEEIDGWRRQVLALFDAVRELPRGDPMVMTLPGVQAFIPGALARLEVLLPD